MTDRGTFVDFDGRPGVRFERTYPHPPERVWAAITEPGELAPWFPTAGSLEPRFGGAVTFTPTRTSTTGRGRYSPSTRPTCSPTRGAAASCTSGWNRPAPADAR